jgi:putative heme-binding domain-containing protein
MKLFSRIVLLAVLAVALRAWAQNDDALPALVEVLKSADDAQLQLDVLKGLSEGLKGRRGVKAPAGWDEVSAKLAKSGNAQIRELTQQLSLVFGSAGAMGELRRQLLDAKAPVAARVGALESLLAARDAELPGALRQLLGDAAMRGAALRGLVYRSLTATEKRDALATLSSRVSFARALANAFAEGGVPARDLPADLARQLRGFQNAEINAALDKHWGAARESSADKQKEMTRYKAMIAAKTGRAEDLSRGRLVFVKTCGQCHALYGLGGKVGPDITGSNRADLDYLLHNILDPNAEIPNDYRTWNLETKDERSISGVLTRQDAQTVTLATPGETLTVSRADIRSLRQSELSMMPEGLLQALADDEVRDLVAYLRGKSQAPLPATPETAGLFFNGKDLSFWDGDAALWRVENGEIIGTSGGLRRNEFLRSQLLLGDFRLVTKVKLVPDAGNSGIQFRSEVLPDGSMRGCQADVGVGWWGKLYEEHARGLLWKESGEAHVKRNDWNTYEVLAVGSKIRTAINGHLCVDLDDAKVARSGVVGLQLHSGGAFEVRFREFELELNPKFELKTVR